MHCIHNMFTNIFTKETKLSYIAKNYYCTLSALFTKTKNGTRLEFSMQSIFKHPLVQYMILAISRDEMLIRRTK